MSRRDYLNLIRRRYDPTKAPAPPEEPSPPSIAYTEEGGFQEGAGTVTGSRYPPEEWKPGGEYHLPAWRGRAKTSFHVCPRCGGDHTRFNCRAQK